jgi:uncharacterized membrane protein YdjX (TVP38/TMEM64 family)
MYNYMYGATSLRASDFVIGTALGSIKPYLFDSYLGEYNNYITAPTPVPVPVPVLA